MLSANDPPAATPSSALGSQVTARCQKPSAVRAAPVAEHHRSAAEATKMNESTSSGASQACSGLIPPDRSAKARMASNEVQNAAAATPQTTAVITSTTPNRKRRSTVSVNTTAIGDAGAVGAVVGSGIRCLPVGVAWGG